MAAERWHACIFTACKHATRHAYDEGLREMGDYAVASVSTKLIKSASEQRCFPATGNQRTMTV